jgi:soluble lytic murein transglycosylase
LRIFRKVSRKSSQKTLAFLAGELGRKSEEFFPDTEIRDQVIRLYEKAVRCDSTEEAPRYRLALLHLWKGACAQAVPHLQVLSASTESDFQMRSLYWLSQCLRKSGDAKTAEFHQKSLIEKYPLSFQSLLMAPPAAGPLLNSDSPLRFQSKAYPKLNQRVREIETLLRMNELGLAREAAMTLKTQSEGEPEFRLYLGLLHQRLQQYQQSFQILSGLMKENPGLMSRASLELLYPKYSISKKLTQNPTLLVSLIRQESAFNPMARSSAGALGLMQLMPATARRYEKLRRNDRLFQPTVNLRIGSRYFSELLNRYRGDPALALAAYNAGENAIDRWVTRYPVQDRVLFMDLIPYKETRNYVSSIARNYYWYQALYPEEKTPLAPRLALGDLKQVFRLVSLD